MENRHGLIDITMSGILLTRLAAEKDIIECSPITDTDELAHLHSIFTHRYLFY